MSDHAGGKAPHFKYRPDIDGLRAISVLAVVGFHANPGLVPGGFVGVDVFFVISGYLISSLIFEGLEQGAFSFLDFWARRIRRIFPALLVVLISVWVAGWYLLLPTEFRLLGKHIFAAAGFVSNFMFWSEAGYFDPGAELKPLLHLWSLGVEEQFYILWPVTVFLAWKARVNVLGVILAVGAISFALNVVVTPSAPASAFYLPAPRIWELLVGAALARLHVSRWPALSPRMTNAACVAGLLMILAAFALLDRERQFPGWWAALPVAGACLCIAAGRTAWIGKFVLGNRALVLVGLISYPLYLWHWPLLTFARISQPQAPSGLVAAALVVLAFVLAAMTYLFVERPLRSIKARRAVVAIGLAAAMAAVAPVGLATAYMMGFPARVPATFWGLGRQTADATDAYRIGTCFLTSAGGSFADACVDAEKSPRQRLVVLWGDSHAAHLYPGLMARQSEQPFRLAQFTTASCPPLVNIAAIDLQDCETHNRMTIERISELKPDWVIVAANWRSAKFQDAYLSAIEATAGQLRRGGVQNILLVGPVPSWYHGLVRKIFERYRHDPQGEVPTYVDDRDGIFRDLDDKLSRESKTLGIGYVSAYSILCKGDGCLARVGDKPSDVVAWDESHFTVAGSKYFVARFPAAVFE